MQCLDYTDLYRTAPLHDPKTQIRLLRATQLEEQYLSYEFIVCDLADAPPYDAISYTWGDPDERGFIRVNNVPISVTENCWYALWQVRQLGSTHIWVDAVCIDQQNLKEKGAQVAFMFYIYTSAAQVLACIGPPDEVSERVSAALIELGAQKVNNDDDRHAIMTWVDRKDDIFCNALYQDLEHLSSRPYFSRLWIAQELYAGGPRACIVFDRARIPWELVTALHRVLVRVVHNALLRGTAMSMLEELIATGATANGSHLEGIDPFLCHDVRDKIYGTLHFFRLGKYWNCSFTTRLQ